MDKVRTSTRARLGTTLASRRGLQYRARQRGAGPRRGRPMTLTLSVLWRKYISQLRVERGVVENTVNAYETGWNSFSACARALGWRLKVAEDLTYERLVEWQLNQKEVGQKEWTCRTYLMALKGFSRWLNVICAQTPAPASRHHASSASSPCCHRSRSWRPSSSPSRAFATESSSRSLSMAASGRKRSRTSRWDISLPIKASSALSVRE